MTIALTHSPLQGAQFQEAQRTAMMFGGLGHEVSFVLIDDGVLSLLEGSGYAFGLRKLGRLQGIEGLSTYVLESSRKRLVPHASMPRFKTLSDGDFAGMLMSSKVVVF